MTRPALPSDGFADSHMPSIFISLFGQLELQPSGIVMPYSVIFFHRIFTGRILNILPKKDKLVTILRLLEQKEAFLPKASRLLLQF